MKTAKKFEDIETGKISKEAVNDPCIQAFAQDMMDLSNEINHGTTVGYIKSVFMPAIREFIANTTGL